MCAPAAPSKGLKGEVPSAHRDPETLLSTLVFALGRGPQSSQRGHPAFGACKFRSSGRAPALPASSLGHVPPGPSLENAEDPPPRPASAPRDTWAEERWGGPHVRAARGGAGAKVVDEGRELGRGARCSPVKAPTAFLMSSAWSKSVIDILQLFERAEQV